MTLTKQQKRWFSFATLIVVAILTNTRNLNRLKGRSHISTNSDTSSRANKSAIRPHSQNGDSFLLSALFYVYEELNWLERGTVGNRTFLEHALSLDNPKHNEDIQFLIAALKHPMRTHRPEDAKIFVVPFLSSIITLNLVYWKTNIEPCVGNVCGHDLIHYIDGFLANSTWFQRNGGNDHLLTYTYLHAWHPTIGHKYHYKHLKRCHVVQFGEIGKVNDRDRLSFYTFYVGTPCPMSLQKSTDLAMIGSDKPGDARFQSRRDICQWVSNYTNYSMPQCGPGRQCPALADARLGFHVRGDGYGANRLIDTLLSGTVPIFTHQEQYDLMPGWFDWSLLSYFAPVSNQTSFLTALHSILARPRGEIETKIQNVVANRDLFDWETLVPFDTYMYMLQAQLGPKTRINTTRYTALLLPPVLNAALTNASRLRAH